MNCWFEGDYVVYDRNWDEAWGGEVFSVVDLFIDVRGFLSLVILLIVVFGLWRLL